MKIPAWIPARYEDWINTFPAELRETTRTHRDSLSAHAFASWVYRNDSHGVITVEQVFAALGWGVICAGRAVIPQPSAKIFRTLHGTQIDWCKPYSQLSAELIGHRCQWDMPDDVQPDSERCPEQAIDGRLYCQTHQDLHDDLTDQHREQDGAYQS